MTQNRSKIYLSDLNKAIRNNDQEAISEVIKTIRNNDQEAISEVIKTINDNKDKELHRDYIIALINSELFNNEEKLGILKVLLSNKVEVKFIDLKSDPLSNLYNQYLQGSDKDILQMIKEIATKDREAITAKVLSDIIRYQDEILFEVLFSKVQDPNLTLKYTDDEGEKSITLLGAAMERGNEVIIQSILDHPNLDMKVEDLKKYTDFAIKNNQLDLVEGELREKFLSYFSQKDLEEKAGAYRFFPNETQKKIYAFIKANKDTGKNLLSAIHQGRYDEAKQMISEGAWVNIESKGETPLLLAMKSGNQDIVKKLLEKGADPNVVGRISQGSPSLFDTKDIHTPLSLAAGLGDVEVVRTLLKYGANVNNQPRYWNKYESYFSSLFLSAERRDKKFSNPLIEAVKSGNKEIAALLLEKGADPNMTGPSGNTALNWAIAHNRADIAKLLLEKGASFNIKTHHSLKDIGRDRRFYVFKPFSETSLHLAKSLGRADISREFVIRDKFEKKADQYIKTFFEKNLPSETIGILGLENVLNDKKVEKYFGDESKSILESKAADLKNGDIKLGFTERLSGILRGKSRESQLVEKTAKEVKTILKEKNHLDRVNKYTQDKIEKDEIKNNKVMQYFLPAAQGPFLMKFVDYQNDRAEIVRPDTEQIKESAKVNKDFAFNAIKIFYFKDKKDLYDGALRAVDEKDLKDLSEKGITLSAKDDEALQNKLVEVYEKLADEMDEAIKSLLTQEKDAATIALKAGKHTSFTKAMEDINAGKSPEIKPGSAASLFKEAVEFAIKSVEISHKARLESDSRSSNKGHER